MSRSRTATQGRLVRRAALWACLGTALVVVSLGVSGCTSSEPPKVVNTYGGLPSYLAKIPSASDDVLTGTTTRPVLTSEGDSVKMKLADGATLLATATGPVVPGEGLPHQTTFTTCTWTVSLSGASKAVPIRLSDLTTVDQLGNVYRLSPVPGKPALPTVLEPGKQETFEVRTAMKVGEGLLRWAPGGSKIVAEWDFEVEND